MTFVASSGYEDGISARTAVKLMVMFGCHWDRVELSSVDIINFQLFLLHEGSDSSLNLKNE